MTITRNQAVAMAAIVLLGLLAGGGMLWSDRRAAGSGEAAHADGEPAHGTEAAGGESAHRAPAGGGAKHDDRFVKLSEDQTKRAGIELRPAGPATLETALDFPGEIRFDEDRTAHLVPRLAGVAEQVPARLGETVRKGQVLAVLASPALSDLRSELLTARRRREAADVAYQREQGLWQDRISAEQDYLQAGTALQEADIAVQNASQKLAAVGASGTASSTGPTGPTGPNGLTVASSRLNRFEIRAPFDGTVVEKHLTLGEAVKEDARILTLSDLRAVWAEFNLAPKDLAKVRVGQRVRVSSTAFEGRAEGSVAYVGALLGEQSRSARARVTLANPDGSWRPGLFVTVTVLGGQESLAIAIPADAVQTGEQGPVVFKAVPGGFQATPVRLGRADGRHVEVLEGLAAGELVATRNAFVLKSELGKAGAAHGH